MVAPLPEQLQKLSPYRSFTPDENTVVAVTQDR